MNSGEQFGWMAGPIRPKKRRTPSWDSPQANGKATCSPSPPRISKEDEIEMKSVLAIALLLLSACAPRPAVSGEPPSGTWSGDYDAGSDRRESISVDLRWNGTNLRGAVQAGPRSLPLTKASYKSDT